MTTIPTPGDLATLVVSTASTRPLRLSVRTEGEPAPTAPFRERWEWAIKHSQLKQHARHVALTIATWADYQTGLITGSAPGVPTLGSATGLGHLTIRNGLHALVDAGYLQRSGANHSVRMTLTLPDRPR